MSPNHHFVKSINSSAVSVTRWACRKFLLIGACIFSVASYASDEAATKVWSDGTEYVGDLTDGKRTGEGTIIWTDGTRFVGEFVEDLRQGPGKLMLPDGNSFIAMFEQDVVVPGSVRPDQVMMTNSIPSTNEFLLEMSAQLEAELENSILSWASAWASQDLAAYFDHYSDQFKPGFAQSLFAWRQLRRQRINRPEEIQVETTIRRFELQSSDSASVVFDQRYRSDLFSDRTLKKLVFVREDSVWKIQREIVLPR